jgi:Protein of unknown function (DUF2815)
MADSIIVRTPQVRLSFPNLMKPRGFVDKAKGITAPPTYSSDFLMEPADLDNFQVLKEDKWDKKNLKVILAEAARGAWGQDYDLKGAIQHGGLKWPIKDGNAIAEKRRAAGKKHDEVTVGKVIISAKSKEEYAPALFVLDAGKAVTLDRQKDADRINKLFVGGMYVIAGLALRANETPQGRFLNMYLNSVLYIRPGERIGGIDPSTMFADIEGGEAAFDPTAGADLAGI